MTIKKLKTKIIIKASLQKMNDSPDDCQDAIAANPQTGRYAVADGVAMSFFPAVWSKLLVKRFCFDTSEQITDLFNTKNWQEWLEPIRIKWDEEVREQVKINTGSASVYLKNNLKLNSYAGSTFTGIQINQNQGVLEWHGMIIGDSCLFHFRNEKLKSYLIKSSGDFDFHPEYFSSVSSGDIYKPSFISDTFEEGDVLLLATDALSKWLLVQYEAGVNHWNRVWAYLMNLQNWNDLNDFVQRARKIENNPMLDDDVALMILLCEEQRVSPNIEMFKKPTQRVEFPTAMISKPSAPSRQSSSTTKKLPETIKDKKLDRIPTKQAYISLVVSLVALCLSLIGMFLSIIIYSRITNFITAQQQAPTLAIPVITRSSPTNDLTTPTDLAIPTDFPALTETNTSIITLSTNTPIYSYPDIQGQPILITQNEIPMVFVVEKIDNWLKTQFDAWLLVSNAEYPNINVQENQVTILSPTDFYLLASLENPPSGNLMQGSVFPKIGEYTDVYGTWLQIRITGYTGEK